MRFTITPLGSVGGRTVGQVVDDIVRYLDRPRPVPASGTGPPERAAGPSRYYSDGGEEPGRWLGQGAEAAELRGEVAPDDFARVLAGRDPVSGARLISARGSAGRRATLGVGTGTRWAENGELLYDEHDPAAALGIEDNELDRLLAAGSRVAVAALEGQATGKAIGQEPPGSYLMALVADDGARWVRESELARLEAARVSGPSAKDIGSGGDPDELLPLAEAARLASTAPGSVGHSTMGGLE